MHNSLKELIQENYGLTIVTAKDGPRQFVAETFIVKTQDGKTYFCKIITKPLFIPHVTESLPVLYRLTTWGTFRTANWLELLEDPETTFKQTVQLNALLA